MNKFSIAPSILSADFGYLMRDIDAIKECCDVIHIDVMDGHYVPNISFGVPIIKSIRDKSDMIFDVHLMLTHPENYIEAFVKAGADRITFHLECTDSPKRLIEFIRSFGLKAGIAIHPDIPIEKVIPFLEKDVVDSILLMSVYPGFGGQNYLRGTDEKLQFLRKSLDENGSEAILSVDGGITVDTIGRAVNSGAELIVAGSAVFGKENPHQAVLDLIEQGNKALD